MLNENRNELRFAFEQMRDQKRIKELLGTYGIDRYCEHLQEQLRLVDQPAEIFVDGYLKQQGIDTAPQYVDRLKRNGRVGKITKNEK